METKARKSDRRSERTRAAIRGSLLALMKEKNFRKATVTELCRAAGINRGTFYLHYLDLDDVLDELLTEMTESTVSVVGHIVCGREECGAYPFCNKMRSDARYQIILTDESITGKIVEKIAETSRDDFVAKLMECTNLSEAEAEALFYFQLNGCLAFNRRMIRSGGANWEKIQPVIDSFIKSGIGGFMAN